MPVLPLVGSTRVVCEQGRKSNTRLLIKTAAQHFICRTSCSPPAAAIICLTDLARRDPARLLGVINHAGTDPVLD